MIEKTRWGIVFLLVATGVVAAFQVGKAAIAVPALRDDLGLSLFTASWVVGALGALGAAAALPASVLLSLLPARAMLIAGLVAVGVASVAGAFAESGGPLIAARVLEGCGFLAITLSTPRLIRLVAAPGDGQTALAFWGAYMPLGSAAMMLAGPLFIRAFGWQGLWLFNGLLPLAFALVIARLPLPPGELQSGPAHRLSKNLREAFTTPGPALLAVTFGAYTFQYFALSSLFPALLVEQLGLSIGTAGLISAGTVLANGAGNLVAGALLRLGVPIWLIVMVGFLACGTIAFGIFSDALPIVLIAVLAATSLAVTGLIPATIFAAVPSVSATPALFAITFGMITQLGISGQLVGPASLAAFVERFGWAQAPTLFVAVMVMGIALALALRAVLRKHA
jgi:predicted MFS family arabinose efflux permease